VIYSVAPSLNQAINYLQLAFNQLQISLHGLKLVLNTKKTKTMMFSRARSQSSDKITINTLDGDLIENVSSYKYLGFWLDNKLSFKVHVEKLVKKLKLRLGFYFRHKACFNLLARKKLVQATFLSVLDYGDVVYMHAASSTLHLLDSVYHCVLRFITNSGYRTHHCMLYELVGWTSLNLCRQLYLHIFLYKAMLGKLPAYLCNLLKKNSSRFSLRSTRWFSYQVPRVFTELGKKAFSYFAPWSWNNLQNLLHLNDLVPLNEFKAMLKCNITQKCNCHM